MKKTKKNGFVLFVLLFFLPHAWADSNSTPMTLSPIEVNGSAADALFDDPVVPAMQGRVEPISPSGSLVHDLSEQLPVSTTDYGYPGTVSQIRGLGRTVEDTNVETLGVPLNLPQGGGFDFSTFAQFFWSSYQFRLGPVGTAFDPRASTGAIALTPWTAAALDDSAGSQTEQGRFTVLGGRFIGQTSAAAHYGDAAILVGGTVGLAHGPTGSFSLRLPDLGKIHWRAHLLATSMDAATPGPSDEPAFFSPDARQTGARLISVLEGSAELDSGATVKSSIFFDRSWSNYEDPDLRQSSVTRTDQYGVENAISAGVFTLGLTGKRATLIGEDYAVPTENSANLRAGPTLHFGPVTLDGFGGADYVSGTGWEPDFSVGAKDDFSDQGSIYTRESYNWRFPTLIDRFAAYPPYSVANPSLLPEQVMTALAGTGYHGPSVHADLVAMAQARNRAQLYVTNPATQIGETVNSGHTEELTVIPSVGWDVRPWLELFQSVRFSHSVIVNDDQAIPYDPAVTYLAEARVHAPGDNPLWKGAFGVRALSSAVYDYAGDRLPGYGLAHVDFQYKLNKKISFEGRIENLLNRDPEVTAGYPLPGRIFALGAVGSL